MVRLKGRLEYHNHAGLGKHMSRKLLDHPYLDSHEGPAYCEILTVDSDLLKNRDRYHLTVNILHPRNKLPKRVDTAHVTRNLRHC
jgi:hypothetical protein